jgi:hypothetical protein
VFRGLEGWLGGGVWAHVFAGEGLEPGSGFGVLWGKGWAGGVGVSCVRVAGMGLGPGSACAVWGNEGGRRAVGVSGRVAGAPLVTTKGWCSDEEGEWCRATLTDGGRVT